MKPGPDEFETFFGRFLTGIVANSRAVGYALLAILVAAGGFLYWNYHANEKARELAEKFENVLKNYPTEKAQKSAWELFAQNLDEFAKNNSDNSLVPSAKMYRAKALMMLGKYNDAQSLYKEAGRKMPAPYLYLAREGEALALMEQQKWDEAEKIWTELTGLTDNPSKAFHAWNLGLTQEGGKKIAGALKTYQDFETKFGDSPLLEQVRARLSALKQNAS